MSNPEIYSTVPVSSPRLFPDGEDYRMNGFCMSDDIGIIVQYRRDGDPSLDPINQMRNGFNKHNPELWRKAPSSQKTIEAE